MTDYPYDPELPYVVVQVCSYDEHEFPVGSINARFRDADSAREYASDFMDGYVKFVDTTPAPKIPADAEFIYWVTPSNAQYYAKRLGHPNNKVWLQDSGRNYDEDDLIEAIGYAEVVVLKRA